MNKALRRTGAGLFFLRRERRRGYGPWVASPFGEAAEVAEQLLQDGQSLAVGRRLAIDHIDFNRVIHADRATCCTTSPSSNLTIEDLLVDDIGREEGARSQFAC